MRYFAWILTVILFGNSAAFAQEKLLKLRELKFIYYDIGGATIDEILDQLNNNPLNDHWGYTTTGTNVWPECSIEFWAKVTMPRLVHPETLSDKDRREVERMIEALKQHEMRHVYIGLYLAEEFARDGCPKDFSYLSDYWHSKDKELDKRTSHGARDGVHLFRRIRTSD